tara:strand:+ start:165 stop:359 length:195 start_codon:yes stop_codon:yes gene_type:complete
MENDAKSRRHRKSTNGSVIFGYFNLFDYSPSLFKISLNFYRRLKRYACEDAWTGRLRKLLMRIM